MCSIEITLVLIATRRPKQSINDIITYLNQLGT